MAKGGTFHSMGFARRRASGASGKFLRAVMWIHSSPCGRCTGDFADAANIGLTLILIQ
jgi:hypothetical protein